MCGRGEHIMRGHEPLCLANKYGGDSMRNFIIKRVLLSVVILFFVAFIIYTLLRCLPSSYVETMARQLAMAPGAKPYEEWVKQLNAQYGLDLPLIPGFFHQLGNILTGNFGDSWNSTPRPTTPSACSLWLVSLCPPSSLPLC